MTESSLVRFTLGNGLRVILAPDHSAPVVGVTVHYDVGYRSEPQGRAGFAHLFEHLLFQGSESLDKLAHFRHVLSSGGSFNGATRQDFTHYFVVVPSAGLERALFLEADRMRAPRLTEENLANQLDVVKEEIRLRVLNQPYGGLPWIWLPPLLYDTFPNAHNGFGDFTDLEGATIEDCAAFFDTYYTPSNAVLTVAGDIAIDETRDLVQRQFGDVPARPAPARKPLAEPAPDGERRGVQPDPLAPMPALAVGYRMPDPLADFEAYLAHVVLAGLLTEGDGARLQRRMVHDEALAVEVAASAGMFGPFKAREPDMLYVKAVHSAEVSAQRLLDALDAELEELACNPPAPTELGTAVSRWLTKLHTEHDRLISRALSLGALETLFGDARLLYRIPEGLAAVTAHDVAAAAKNLSPSSRGVLLVEPAPRPQADTGSQDG